MTMTPMLETNRMMMMLKIIMFIIMFSAKDDDIFIQQLYVIFAGKVVT